MKTEIGWVVGCWAAGIILAACLLWTVGHFIYWRVEGNKDGWAINPGWSLLWATLIAAITIGFFVAVAWPPFNMEYHSWKPVTGSVAKIESRLIDQTTVYALSLSDGHIYRCDDTRCSLIHPGSQVSLWCIRVWQEASTPAWQCNVDRIDGQEVEG